MRRAHPPLVNGGQLITDGCPAPTHDCPTPGWRARTKNNVCVGAIWECACGQRWTWRAGDFWDANHWERIAHPGKPRGTGAR